MNRWISLFLSIPSIVAVILAWTVPTTAQSSPLLPELQAPNVLSPIKGLLVGGQPSKMDLEKIKNHGFETIISLRPVEEDLRDLGFNEQTEVSRLGLKFVRIPIMSHMDLTKDNLTLLDEALEMAGGKAFVHCSSGNKVGAMLAMRAFKIQNIPFGKAVELGEEAGMKPQMREAVINLMKQSDKDQQ